MLFFCSSFIKDFATFYVQKILSVNFSMALLLPPSLLCMKIEYHFWNENEVYLHLESPGLRGWSGGRVTFNKFPFKSSFNSMTLYLQFSGLERHSRKCFWRRRRRRHDWKILRRTWTQNIVLAAEPACFELKCTFMKNKVSSTVVNKSNFLKLQTFSMVA